MSALPFISLKFICSCCYWFTCLVILIRPTCYLTSASFVYKDLTGIYINNSYVNNNNNISYPSVSSSSSVRSERNYLRVNDSRDGTNNVITNDFVLSGEGVDRDSNHAHVDNNHDDDGSFFNEKRNKRAVTGEDFYDENTDMSYDEDDEDDYGQTNSTEKGRLLGAPCENTCNPDLQHVVCDAVTGLCECDKSYPVKLGPTKGCAKPKRLGEQCYYRATCTFSDQHSTCTQVLHNAVCDCSEGYHRVAAGRSNKKAFCAEDLVLISTDMSTLLGIASGIAVLTGLMCFVLKLFSRARYSRPRHYANANHAPPMLFSSDTGIPLTLSGRPSSRSSQRSDGDPLNCSTFRRPSSGGSRGPLVPASRAGAARAAAILLISCHLQATKDGTKHRRTLSDVAEGSTDGLGSRRPSLASLHSSVSSARSYSAKRLERERNEKEQRQALQELRMSRQRDSDASQQQLGQQQQQQNQHQHQHQQLQLQQQTNTPCPSPRTPHSTDELLPAVEEGKEAFYNEVATTSGTSQLPSTSRSKLTHQKSLSSLPLTTTAVTSSTTVSSTMPSKKKRNVNNETAFTTSSAVCTTAFNNNRDTGNCSNVVDIFES
ncbi:uncharacterized protein LOC130671663 isoform X1 [Microplitis mediator]|uniref:uncharacterized protein LOC130671663 isoform X1 n=1 Tax=Microplitis mediator TaxID=375433 RepID=UPI002554868D|nr:uncharacterized protein LOC130671663 isoform X1 [Microplitis mediator]